MVDVDPQLLPWQQENWRRIQQVRQSNRLPHALLLTGVEGIGKHRFGRFLAHSLLCEQPNDQGQACGQCRGCHLFQVGNHPDFISIEPDEPGKAIKIDTIRELVDKGGMTAQAGGYKVIIIEPADAMNTAAANSLLKTLEEPVPWTVLLLISSRSNRLPVTIRSRCQQLTFPLPPRDQAAQWLATQVEGVDIDLLLGLSGGAPLLARSLANSDILQERGPMVDDFYSVLTGKRDPVAVAGRWEKLDLVRVLDWMSSWLIDMLRLKSEVKPPRLHNPDQCQQLHSLAQQIDIRALYGLLDRVYEANRTRDSQLNRLLLLESLLLACANCNAGSRV